MKIKRLRPECLSCLIKRYLEKYPENARDDLKLEYMRRTLRILADAPETDCAPVVVSRISAVRAELFGVTDEYSEIKKYFNQLMLNMADDIYRKIEVAADPLLLAIQYSRVANYIDFGALKSVDEHHLMELMDNASQNPIPSQTYEALKQELAAGKKLVILTDNCGEIVMDKLLIMIIKKLYPHLEITVLVKGGNVLNDATLEDALQVGMTDVAKVVDNGNHIAGTWLAALSPEAGAEFDSADVILSKGQANYETLRLCGANIYYLFLCKCDMFARDFGVKPFTGMFIREQELH